MKTDEYIGFSGKLKVNFSKGFMNIAFWSLRIRPTHIDTKVCIVKIDCISRVECRKYMSGNQHGKG